MARDERKVVEANAPNTIRHVEVESVGDSLDELCADLDEGKPTTLRNRYRENREID